MAVALRKTIPSRRSGDRICMIEHGYQTLLGNAWDLLFQLSPEGQIVSLRGNLKPFIDDLAPLIPGTSFLEHVYAEDAARVAEHLQHAAGGGLASPIEFRLRTRHGVLVRTEADFASFRGEDGRPALLGVARDIAEHKQAVERMRDWEARFHELVEGTRAVPFEADCLQRCFTYVGPQAGQLLGFPSENWLDGDFWFAHVHPADRRLLDRFPAGSATDAPDQELIYRMIASDGRTVWLLHLARRHAGGRRCRGFLIDVTTRHMAQAELERSREQHRALAARTQQAREEERLHVAREIHDELGQSLTCLRMDTMGIRRALHKQSTAADLAAIDARLANLEELTAEAMRSVRRIATQLRPPVLDRIGLFAAIEWQAQEFETRFGVPCALERPHAEPVLEPERATAVFRIFQEVLTNIARHAEAKMVRVTLRVDGGGVRLMVADDGRGVQNGDLRKSGALGVLGMEERAHAFGGAFSFQPAERGTRALLTMPLVASAPPSSSPTAPPPGQTRL